MAQVATTFHLNGPFLKHTLVNDELPALDHEPFSGILGCGCSERVTVASARLLPSWFHRNGFKVVVKS